MTRRQNGWSCSETNEGRKPGSPQKARKGAEAADQNLDNSTAAETSSVSSLESGEHVLLQQLRRVTNIIYDEDHQLQCINIGIHSFRVKVGTFEIQTADIVNNITLSQFYPDLMP